ncbi:helix-turn-helix transcriptional regulator [Rhodococcus ruber]|uniref:helix-turn-helix transcriptional regulator n=1 Tax=Rhodococcus ruber TaxID=1830 RepID=UPI003D818F4E
MTTIPTDPDALLTSEQASALLGFKSPHALKALRYKGRGPAAVYLSSRLVRYRRSDVLAWIDENVVDPSA